MTFEAQCWDSSGEHGSLGLCLIRTWDWMPEKHTQAFRGKHHSVKSLLTYNNCLESYFGENWEVGLMWKFQLCVSLQSLVVEKPWAGYPDMWVLGSDVSSR